MLGTGAFALSTMSVATTSAAGLNDRSELATQRRHVWNLMTRLTAIRSSRQRPAFESWYGEDAAFAADSVPAAARGIEAFSRVSPRPLAAANNSGNEGDAAAGGQVDATGDIPLLTYVLYSPTAYLHIRRNELYLTTRLASLRDSGPLDPAFAGDHRIPDFPDHAAILKTAWWPIAPDRLTALPVWDPELNPARAGGNPYTSWQRVVAVDPAGSLAPTASAPVEFAGRVFPEARRAALASFYYVRVDAALAARMTRDRPTRKAAIIALGRELRAGDYLALVSMNLAVREAGHWKWATFWWHDHPDRGPFAEQRPDSLTAEWRHYLMQVSFDAERPLAADGGPHVCFDPYLEGRFPDGGQGGGTVSNCVACHQRASYPAVSFLPVTRGGPDRTSDPAYAPGRLRTGFIWSLAMHSAP
jgi:hypothetical protein